MNKEIYFCVDSTSFNKVIAHIVSLDFNWASCFDYATTEKNLKEECRYIVTSSIAHLSFDLLTLGYDIYLCYKDKRVKIEPHMDLSGIGEPGKDLRFGHNIFKLFRAGIFNDLLGIEKGGEE